MQYFFPKITKIFEKRAVFIAFLNIWHRLSCIKAPFILHFRVKDALKFRVFDGAHGIIYSKFA